MKRKQKSGKNGKSERELDFLHHVKVLSGADESFIRTMVDRKWDKIDKLRKHMSPPGKLPLPPKLEEARLKYNIVDECFRVQPTFDKVWVFQVSDATDDEERQFSNPKVIVASQVSEDADTRECPRGILINGGLSALDQLFSNGVGLGDMIEFSEVVPYRRIVVRADGTLPVGICMMRAGDISGSHDLGQRLMSGEVRVVAERQDPGNPESPYEHYYTGPDGLPMPRINPYIREDK